MSDKKDREVRKLFSIANSVAMDLLNDDDLTPAEIFIGSCKMALESHEELPTSYESPLGTVDKNNIAFSLDEDDAIIIMGDQQFEYDLSGTVQEDYDEEN